MGDAKKVCDEIWEIIESGKLERLDEVVDADCDFKFPGMAFKGSAGLRQMLGVQLAGFPDLRHHARSFVESGDTIALEVEVSGTHSGALQTPNGTIPATGKKVIWECCDYVRVRGGKAISFHVYYDTMPFLTALGLVPQRG